MKELEQEKDSLLAGLEVVERARDWYQGQIHNVTERQRQVGQNSNGTVSTGPDGSMNCIMYNIDFFFQTNNTDSCVSPTTISSTNNNKFT